MFETKLEGEKMTFLTFCVKDHPNGHLLKSRKIQPASRQWNLFN